MSRHKTAARLICLMTLPALSAPLSAREELGFQAVLEQVSACNIELGRYKQMWVREDAVLINLPASGAINGILVTQFYIAPGRNGAVGDYGVVFNAPVAQVISTFPEFAGNAMMNGRERQLVSLFRETGNPRNRSQTLLVCRGGTSI